MTELGKTEGLLVLFTFGGILFLLVMYIYEYVKRRTVPSDSPRKYNRLLFALMGTLSLYMAVRASPLAGFMGLIVVILCILWDKNVVDKSLK
jgi:nicotinamide riboside transporter PnuC